MRWDSKLRSAQQCRHGVALLRWRRKLMGIMLFVVSGIMNHALAACPVISNITAPSAVDVNPTLPIGSVIGTLYGTFASGSGCSTSFSYAQVYGIGDYKGNLYSTSIPGVAYRGMLTSGLSSNVVLQTLLNKYWPTGVSISPNQKLDNFMGGNVKIEFVKTGPVPSSGGVLQPGTISILYGMNGMTQFNMIIFNLVSPIIIAPTNPACTVTSANVIVPLNNVSQSSLSSAGITAGETGFTIPLQCDSSANISLQFSGDAANAVNGVFKNTNSANANNVGIQLLKDGQPVSITTGSYLAVGTVNGTVNFPMIARYYALTAGVPAGDVNAVAYATIIYN